MNVINKHGSLTLALDRLFRGQDFQRHVYSSSPGHAATVKELVVG
jgi:hypothetical protein